MCIHQSIGEHISDPGGTFSKPTQTQLPLHGYSWTIML